MSATVQISEKWENGKVRTFKYTFKSARAQTNDVSDGYHTFGELYHYRMLYNAAFFNNLKHDPIWVHGAHKSKKHSDGTECFGGGWFVVVANLPTGQITNHYKMEDWDYFNIPEHDQADVYDGHTPEEAAERLERYVRGNW